MYFKINIASINIFKIRSIIELKKLPIHDSLVKSTVEPNQTNDVINI